MKMYSTIGLVALGVIALLVLTLFSGTIPQLLRLVLVALAILILLFVVRQLF